MNITGIIVKMDDFTDEERVKYLKPIMDKFSGVSKASISSFQNGWDDTKFEDVNVAWKEFVKAQNEVIRMCIGCENSSVGADIRSLEGLPVWDMNEEIGE